MTFYRQYGKRILDLIGASLALVILSPVLLVVAGLVRIKLGSPVIFRQTRPGRHGRLFTLFKFRSMSEAKDPDGRLLPDGCRLTRFGRFLRAASIDELPELFNILRGEMSIVGPRPLLTQYLDRYTPEQARRHDLLPGITGWAQINGRNALTWEEKFALDTWYVDHWTLGVDCKILAMTVWSVLRRDGISRTGHATMPEFMGTKIAAPPAGDDRSAASMLKSSRIS
jgi:lipopolysaccharide/colanic/teichoic acid biosynthesis glycosyltransferase